MFAIFNSSQFSFNLWFLYELKYKVHLSKTVWGIFYFDSVSFLLKFIFLFNKMDGLFHFEARHNSFQNKNNRKATHSLDSRPVIFKLQQEVSKFNVICMSWSSPKTDRKFLNLENRRFLERQFFSMILF